jgi:hypothetical protein
LLAIPARPIRVRLDRTTNDPVVADWPRGARTAGR